MPAVLLTDFHFDLPAELIAQQPLAERSASRLLHLDGANGSVADQQFAALPTLLRRGDLLVFNDTRVVAARIHGRKPSGGAVELLLERAVDEREALVQARASKGLRDGQQVLTAGGAIEVLAREGEFWRVRLPAPVHDFFDAHGEVPLPPYIERSATGADRERYQSVLARHPGAVAAPTASLHFDAPLLAALDALGVERTCVTLHVGAGTFQPVRVADPAEHVMHSERYVLDAAAAATLDAARARGGRIIAVGTTVVRVLETLAPQPGEPWRAAQGATRIFIRPGHVFRAIDALITNFHLPQSTLLMLVAAFAGHDAVMRAYRHAVAQRYRFFSYGDAMFVTPQTSARADTA
jgi:S-adenosylmethionine:tRNA ribosyltransferase-isomerase